MDVFTPELTDVYGRDRISLKGPDVMINARAALALGMSIHELATNAAKYGALSTERGRLAVSWSRVDEGDGEVLALRWVETDGPPVVKPVQVGFGSQLLRTWRSSGAWVDASTTNLMSAASRQFWSCHLAALRRTTVMLPTNLRHFKVLYVEDEPLIAMDGEAMLNEIGFERITVSLTLADAQAAIAHQTFDLALMDINLGNGQTSMPLARALSGRGTILLFASGYNSNGGILAHTFGPRLEKPFDQEPLLRAILSATAAHAVGKQNPA